MDHRERVELIRAAIPRGGGIWADFGSGAGAFTLALAELLGGSARLYSVDRDKVGLERQERDMRDRFPGVHLHTVTADFTKPLDLPAMNGALAANALHFVSRAGPCLRLLAGYLKPGGSLVVVEYETSRAGPWVPFPLPFRRLAELSEELGFAEPRLVGSAPSRYHGVMYAAAIPVERG